MVGEREKGRWVRDGSTGGRSDDPDRRVVRVPRPELARGHRRPAVRARQLHALRGRGGVPGRPDRPHHKVVGDADRVVRRRAPPRNPRRRLPHAVIDHRARPGVHRPGPGADRRVADRRTAQARDHADRRVAHGGSGARGLRLRAGPGGQGDLHPVPQDAQRRRVRRLHRRDSAGPACGDHHRAAGRLRARADHRRLPPGRALRGGPAGRGEAGRACRAGRGALDRGGHPGP